MGDWEGGEDLESNEEGEMTHEDVAALIKVLEGIRTILAVMGICWCLRWAIKR